MNQVNLEAMAHKLPSAMTSRTRTTWMKRSLRSRNGSAAKGKIELIKKYFEGYKQVKFTRPLMIDANSLILVQMMVDNYSMLAIYKK